MKNYIGIDTIERFYRRRAVVALHRIAQGLWDAPAVIGLWLWYAMLVWQRRANHRRLLAAMDDRQLADIGVSRSDANREAAKPFWKR